MQKNPSASLDFRVSTHQTYQPKRTQPWKGISSKFTKHEILSSLSKIKEPNYLTSGELENWKSNENKIIKDLENSFEIEYLDRGRKSLIGAKPISDFYKHYKKLPKIMDQNQFQNISPSIYTKILRKSEELEVLPLKFGVIKDKGQQNHINIQESLYGKKYMEVLFEGTQSLPITECNFNGTRFSQYSKNKLSSISQPMLKDIEILKLQKNSLSNSSIRSVHRFFQNTSKLIQLDLGDNRLNDNGVLNLCEILQNNSKIKILNLSKNGLTEKCIKGIINLDKGNSLEEIYLQWNKINSLGGRELFTHIIENQENSLKILDISWNLLGKDHEMCESIQKLIKQNKEQLYHLNLSNNHFTKQQCVRIGNELKSNNSLYGFHFEGHSGYIDSRGFLRMDQHDKVEQSIKINPNLKKSTKEKMMTTASSLKSQKGIKSNSLFLKQKPLGTKVPSNHKPSLLRNVCWLCEGWIEHQFILQLNDSDQQLSNKPIWIHFSFDNFEGIYIGNKTQKSQFTYLSMIPPTKFQFFWTVGEEQHLSTRYPIVYVKSNYTLQNVRMGEKTSNLFVEKKNYYQSPNKKIFKEDEIFPENIKPRMGVVEEQDEKSEQSPEHTLFKQSFKENNSKEQEFEVKQKFEREWEMFIANQTVLEDSQIMEPVKSLFYHNYELIRDIYRHYGCYSQLGLNHIILDSKALIKVLVDYEVIEGEFGENNVDEILLAMCGENQSYCDMIEGIARPAFIEVVCRIVSIRYEGLDIIEGVKLMLQVLQMNRSIFENFNKWRDRVLFLEGLHKQLKKHYKRFESMFKSLFKTTGTSTIPFTSFNKCFNNRVLENQAINITQIKRAAYYSKPFQDMKEDGKIGICLSFDEFVESVARLAFIDQDGGLIDEFSLSGRKERLQKIIDLLFAKST